MGQNRLTKDEKEELFEMYKTYKYSYKNLSEKFNKSVSSIACLLNRENLKGKRINNHFRKYEINQYFFDNVDTEEKAYFLGFLCADGCNHINNTKVSLTLKESDKEIVQKLNNLIQSNKPLYYGKKSNGENQYAFQISNRRISDRLSELGCIPQKTYTLDFPNESQVPEKFLNHYMRGFCDGDGWIGKKDISITSSNLFCDKLKDYLKIKFNIDTTCRRKGKITELVFSRYGNRAFLNWIYEGATIYLERKYQRYLNFTYMS